jgi:uncharacterized protein YjdB
MLNDSKAAIRVGKSYPLTVKSTHPVTWKSSDESVATVSDSGVVTGIKPGIVSITATLQNDTSQTESIRVTVYEPKIYFAQPSYEFKLTDPTTTYTFVYAADYYNTISVGSEHTYLIDPIETYTWTSSDPTVATVDYLGKVEALKLGESTITVTSSTGLSASTVVKVVEPKVTMTVTPYVPNYTTGAVNYTINVSSTAELEVVYNEDGRATTKYAYTFKSSDESIAKVDAYGKVTGVAAGKATITVTANDAKQTSKSVDINVVEGEGTEVEITKDNYKTYFDLEAVEVPVFNHYACKFFPEDGVYKYQNTEGNWVEGSNPTITKVTQKIYLKLTKKKNFDAEGSKFAIKVKIPYKSGYSAIPANFKEFKIDTSKLEADKKEVKERDNQNPYTFKSILFAPSEMVDYTDNGDPVSYETSINKDLCKTLNANPENVVYTVLDDTRYATGAYINQEKSQVAITKAIVAGSIEIVDVTGKITIS